MSWFTGTALSGDAFLLLAVAAVWLPIDLGGLPLLCGGLFVAIGGVGTLQLEQHGWPLPSAVLMSALIATVVGAAIGAVPRVAAPTLALVTWALSWLAVTFADDVPRLTGGDAGLVGPSLQRWRLPSLGVDVPVNSPTLIVIGVTAAAVAIAINRTLATDRIGLSLRALRDGQELAGTLGCRAEAVRLPAFAITSAWLATAGAGIAVTNNVVSVSDDGPLLSLQLVLAVLLARRARPVAGPVIGAAALIVIDHIASSISNASSIDVDTATAILTAAVFALVLVAPGLLLRRRRVGSTDSSRAEPQQLSEKTAATGDDVLLDLRGISHSYGRIEALSDVSLQIRAGELLGIIGANGSGKSTLLRIACGDLRPASGTIHTTGRVVRCPQATALIETLTIREHVQLGAFASPAESLPTVRRLARTPKDASNRSDRDRRVDLAIAGVGLAQLADMPVRRLDVSARPFVLIAAAIATGARVICLDEPAAGLDDRARQELVPVIQNLCRRGYGVVLVEHDLDLVNQTADRVVALDNGRIIQEDVASAAIATP